MRIELDAFGRRLSAERSDAHWTLYDVGTDGKRSLAVDIAVPDFIGPDELETFIADLMHESATPRHPSVRRLAPETAPSAMTLRRLCADDASRYRDIRLTALEQSPTAFSSSHADESAWPLTRFCERIVPSDNGTPFVWAAFTPHGEIAGTCGLYREAPLKIRHIAWVWGMFVLRPHRRCGVARQLLERVIADARDLPGLRQIQLNVTDPHAHRLYVATGFRQVATLPRSLLVDGQLIDEALMLLELDAHG
jgi:GNAT superfamily N-acetyltransferase